MVLGLDRVGVGRALPRLFLAIFVFAVSFGTFIGGLWAAAGIGGGLLLMLATSYADTRVPVPAPIVAAYVAIFLATIAVMNVYSVNPALSWHLLWQESTIVLPLAVFSCPRVQAHMDDPRLWRVVAWVALVAALALGIEFLSGAPLLDAVKGLGAKLTFYNRGISYLAVFSFPLLAFLWSSGRRWQALAFVCVLAVPVLLTDSRATRAAMGFGLATTVVASVLPVLTQLLLVLCVMFLVAMPWSVTYVFLHDQPWFRHLAPSWQHRIEIWDYMSYRIFDRPWLGWGIGSSYHLDYTAPHGSSYVWIKEAAGHPHDGILQLWVELGIPGLLLGVSFALFTLWRCSKLPRHFAPFAYGAWVAALCVSLVAYNFWDDSLFSLFALTMLSFGSVARSATNRRTRGSPPNRPPW